MLLYTLRRINLLLITLLSLITRNIRRPKPMVTVECR